MEEKIEPVLDKSSGLSQIEFIIQQALMNPNKKSEIKEINSVRDDLESGKITSDEAIRKANCILNGQCDSC